MCSVSTNKGLDGAADTPQTEHVHQDVTSLRHFVLTILDVTWITVPKTLGSRGLRPQTHIAKVSPT